MLQRTVAPESYILGVWPALRLIQAVIIFRPNQMNIQHYLMLSHWIERCAKFPTIDHHISHNVSNSFEIQKKTLSFGSTMGHYPPSSRVVLCMNYEVKPLTWKKTRPNLVANKSQLPVGAKRNADCKIRFINMVNYCSFIGCISLGREGNTNGISFHR